MHVTTIKGNEAPNMKDNKYRRALKVWREDREEENDIL